MKNKLYNVKMMKNYAKLNNLSCAYFGTIENKMFEGYAG